MAQDAGQIYNNFKEQLMLAKFNLVEAGGDVLKLTMHTAYTPDIDAHALWGDAGVSSTEYGTAGGYTAGGKTLASKTVTQDDANDRAAFDAADVTWTSLGPLTPATPSHIILWDDTTTGDMLICYWELGTTATNGGNYVISFGANGIILLT